MNHDFALISKLRELESERAFENGKIAPIDNIGAVSLEGFYIQKKIQIRDFNE